MTAVMVYHIRSKYTAVGKYWSGTLLLCLAYDPLAPGRKEIVLFFYIYAISEILAIFLDSAIIPTYSAVYPVGTATCTIFGSVLTLFALEVVRRCLRGPDYIHLLVSPGQRLRWIPIC